ncbi:restriction endonuclease subunit S [Photobacterium damselae]|nr:restriction endonuclease subunit S [Photobacterium damselae]
MSKVALSGKYRAYPEYKDSGVEWLGDIPLNWSVCRLKQMLSSPMSYGANEAAERAITSEPRYIRITDMNNDGSLKNDTFRSLPWDVANQYLLKDLDILLARSGATVGKSFIYRKDFGNCCYAGYLIKASCDSAKLNPEYAFWFFQSAQYWQYISSSQIQATIQNVSAEKYGEMYLPLPSSINEQNQIAAFLDHETAKIDTLIEKQQKLIELLKEKRQAVISHAVTKGLNPDAPMKDSGVEWLGEVPEHWEVSRLGFHATKIGSGKTPKGGAEIYQDSGVLFLRSQNVYDDGLRIAKSESVYINESIHHEMAGTSVLDGDVLLNITGGSIGRSCLVPTNFPDANVNQHVCILRFPTSIREFISFVMKSNSIKEQIDAFQTGGNREGLNFEQIAKLKFTLPPLNEVNSIIEYIKSITITFNTLEEQAQQAIKLMQERRTALISAAVTGKIDVRNWVAPTTSIDTNEAQQEVTA